MHESVYDRSLHICMVNINLAIVAVIFKLSCQKKKEATFQHRPIIVVPMSYVNTKPSFEKKKIVEKYNL